LRDLDFVAHKEIAGTFAPATLMVLTAM